MATAPIPFAKIVRAELATLRPSFRFTKTTGGSGPLVHFEVPTGAARVAQELVVQKGLYGANWMRVNIITGVIDSAGELQQILQEIAPRLDSKFASAEECAAALRAMLPEMDAMLAKDRKAIVAKLPKILAVLDQLPTLTAGWMKQEGAALDPAMFDKDTFAFDAFKVFERFLTKKKLWITEASQPIWWWWTDHYPKVKGGKVAAKTKAKVKAPAKAKAPAKTKAKAPAKTKTKTKAPAKAKAKTTKAKATTTKTKRR